MYCICCKQNNIKPFLGDSESSDSEEDLLWMNEEENDPRYPNRRRTINNLMVNGGIAGIIGAGYGSNHDGDEIIIGICDECVKTNLEDATLLYFSNYMSPSCKGVDEAIDKSKLMYRRRKNLDGLV